MAKPSPDDMLAAFREMSVLELSGFLGTFEETFGVKAAGPPLIPGPPGVPTDEADEQEEFDVIVEETGKTKIQVLKEVRTLTGLGLKDAKNAIDSTPVKVLSGVDKVTADQARTVLEAAGATVVIR